MCKLRAHFKEKESRTKITLQKSSRTLIQNLSTNMLISIFMLLRNIDFFIYASEKCWFMFLCFLEVLITVLMLLRKLIHVFILLRNVDSCTYAFENCWFMFLYFLEVLIPVFMLLRNADSYFYAFEKCWFM